MSDVDLNPYALARQRFSHACGVLNNEALSINHRLIDAVVALAPLRPEDMPRRCQLLYEKVKQLIGPGLWHSDAMAGALTSAVASLPLRQALTATEWIIMASHTLDKHCGVEATTRTDWLRNSGQ